MVEIPHDFHFYYYSSSHLLAALLSVSLAFSIEHCVLLLVLHVARICVDVSSAWMTLIWFELSMPEYKHVHRTPKTTGSNNNNNNAANERIAETEPSNQMHECWNRVSECKCERTNNETIKLWNVNKKTNEKFRTKNQMRDSMRANESRINIEKSNKIENSIDIYTLLTYRSVYVICVCVAELRPQPKLGKRHKHKYYWKIGLKVKTCGANHRRQSTHCVDSETCRIFNTYAVWHDTATFVASALCHRITTDIWTVQLGAIFHLHLSSNLHTGLQNYHSSVIFIRHRPSIPFTLPRNEMDNNLIRDPSGIWVRWMG